MIRLGAVDPRKETAVGSFVDFAEVKAHCSIEQAAKLLGLQNTEERSHMREPCPICGRGPRAIITVEALGCLKRRPKRWELVMP